MPVKVHPRRSSASSATEKYAQAQQQQATQKKHQKETGAKSLTVWKKSLIFNCHGFTVYDGSGALAYRVDSYDTSAYSSAVVHGRSKLLLMDALGKPLLTLRRKKFSIIGNEWQGFVGESESSKEQPIFTVRKPNAYALLGGFHQRNVNLIAEVDIHLQRGQEKEESEVSRFWPSPHSQYRVEGSYSKRSFTIQSANGEIVAEVKRKQVTAEITLGADVFNLTVKPGIDDVFVMGIIIVLDRIASSQ